MPARSENHRGLFYTRDSGGEHENTPGEYVLWAQGQAASRGVEFTGTPEKLFAMIREGRSVDGDLFLDYGVKGNLLKRPGLDALFAAATPRHGVTHIFVPRRDRFFRPDDPLDAMKMEGELRKRGITLVFSNKTLGPLSRAGRHNLGESLQTLVDYDHAGGERIDLSQKMIYAQLSLAKGGYSTGGRPPFGFRRWLVQGDGVPVRQLLEGESVKMAGHHVVWLPGPTDEIDLILRIVEMLERMPACRVAQQLTREGVPTPDVGRWRTDNGIRHRTSGVWHQTTVTNIARNPLLGAVVEYGRRSMGDRLRFSLEGPRELEHEDHREDGKPKVVANPESARIRASAKFEPLVEPARRERLLKSLANRGGSQRGRPRSKEPTRNPLGGRIFDMNCGWLMYRQPYNDSFRYKCGLYQQSHGSECGHNHVDGLAATKFLLGCIRQLASMPEGRAKLEQKLRALAERELNGGQGAGVLNKKRSDLDAVKRKRERVEQNMALAGDADQYRAIAGMFDQFRKQEKTLEAEIAQLESAASAMRTVEQEVSAALAVLERLGDLAAQRQDLTTIGDLFEKFNARLFLRFTEGRWGKRTVNRMAGGVVTFGETPPPVALYQGLSGGKNEKSPPLPDRNGGLDSEPSPNDSAPSEEGAKISLRNISRGDRI